MRRRVSGETPTLKEPLSNCVIVRHVPYSSGQYPPAEMEEGSEPLTLMLSPKWASPSMSSQFEIVRDVPPPPLELSSWFSRAETAGCR